MAYLPFYLFPAFVPNFQPDRTSDFVTYFISFKIDAEIVEFSEPA